MSAAVHLPVVPDDRFRCVPLSATMAAGRCVQRQTAVGVAGRSQYGVKRRVEYPQCVACALGREVRASVGEVPADWRPAPPAPTNDSPPARLNVLIPEEPVLREAKSDDSSTATVATCNHPDGCVRVAAGARSDTRPGTEGWCRQHRKNAAGLAWKEARRSRAAPSKPAARRARAAKKPAPRLQAATDPMEPLNVQFGRAVRALALVETIGWDLVEQLASKIGRA